MFYEVIKDLTVYNLKFSVDFLFSTIWSSNSTDEVLSRVWQNAVYLPTGSLPLCLSSASRV